MIKKRYRCRNCGQKFETEVFEPGEAEREKRPTYPVQCPECHRADLEEGW